MYDECNRFLSDCCHDDDDDAVVKPMDLRLDQQALLDKHKHPVQRRLNLLDRLLDQQREMGLALDRQWQKLLDLVQQSALPQ